MIQMELPPEFSETLEKSIQEIYRNAIQTARADVGVSREYLTSEEVMKLMHIGRNTLGDWHKQGLPKFKVGNKVYIKRKELNSFIEKHQIY